MFKVCLVLALAVVAVAAQEAPIQPEGAPEPYSYGYSTDTHAAQEQRDPSGRVTGSYQLVGDDGRERRVEYVADEAGFRAKVVTNEMGTKSESPANVELLANEPTPAQYAQAAQSVQYGYAQQQVQRAPVQAVATVQPAGYRQVSSSSYIKQAAAPQQLAGYGYASGYGNGYGYGYYPGNGYSNGYYGYPLGYGAGYSSLGYGASFGSPAVYTTQRSGLVNVGNYNNHLPSQYYRSIGVAGAPAAGAYTQGYRYVSQPAAGLATASYSAAQPIVGNSNLSGSSNYLVLQKRAAAAKSS